MICSDLPITKSCEDRLGRKAFAESLASTLLQINFPSSFTVGLYGSWGSGKTSLLNMILEQVQIQSQNQIQSQSEEVVVLRFNPWLCSDPRQLIAQFFKQLASAIEQNISAMDSVCNLLDQYSDIFDVAALIPYIGGAIAAVGKSVAGMAKDHINRKDNDLQAKKKEIIHILSEKHIRIFVSIDDIDRLSAEEIVAVFQLIKSLADFPNMVYLIAFDYDVVVSALGVVQHGDGREYLEKIIQVPFEIPAPNMESIHGILFSQLEKILGDIPPNRWDKEAWAELFRLGLREYIQSIRDVIRFSNTFYLKYVHLRDETNPVDLLGLTCLQVFEPTVYSLIRHYKRELCGPIGNYQKKYRDDEMEKVRHLVDGIILADATTNKEGARRILGFLFPKTNEAFGNNYSSCRHYDHMKYLVNHNIATTECFDRYFSLALENQAIPAETVRRIVYEAGEDELSTMIDGLYQAGKIVRLLSELEAYANKGDSQVISRERAVLLMSCLCKKWNSFEVEDEGYSAVPFAWRFPNCVDPLLEFLGAADRFAFLKGVFVDPEVAPATLALLLQNLEMQHGRFTDNGSAREHPAISLEELTELEAVFSGRCVDAINTGDALSQNNGLNFLWMLSQIDSEAAKHIKENLVTDDATLAKVISCCTSRGRKLTNLVVKTRQVSKEYLSEFIDIEEARRRIDAFITTQEFRRLSKENQMNVIAFYIAMKRDSKGDPMQDVVTEEEIEVELQKIAEQLAI